MAAATEFLYRNYDSSDATISTAYSNELFPTIENVGWAARAGHIFKEWNTSRDGTGASFDPGDSFPSPASYTTFYAIWEECDVSISYKGSAITTMSASGTEVLETEGKYCEDDITVTYTKTAGSASTPATTITANPTISVSSGGLITASVSGSQSVTPTVSAGYVSSGIAGTITVSGSNTSQLTTQAAQTIHPSTTDQTIASGKYLTGTQTVKGVLLTNLSAGNIKKDVVVKVGDSTDDDCVTSVTGTFEGGGGEDLKNFIEQHETMTSFSNSTISVIGSGVFYCCGSLTTLSLPACTSIGPEAFGYCTDLLTASFPLCTSIGNSAFSQCYSLTTVSFPSCTSIGSNTFYNCTSLTTASFSLCTYIGSSAFYGCLSLTTASFPLCTNIGINTFYNCLSLTTISFPLCTIISTSAFYYCLSLTTVSFPSCTTIGNSAFYYCNRLTTVSFPSCTTIGSSAFYNCSKLTTLSFPLCTRIGNLAFAYCYSLTTLSFPSCTSIGASTFRSCYCLLSLYLTGSSVASLANSNAFTSTPIAGYTTSTGGVYGSIFVPSSLYSTYIASTNWVYFSSRFVSV